MSNNTHAYTAADELDRRAVNRTLKGKGLAKVAGPNTPEGKRLLGMSTLELRTEAGMQAPVAQAPKQARTVQAPKAKAAPKAKPVRTATQVKHTELRAQAYAWRLAEYHAGRSHTVAQANARFGTAPAAITNAPGFEG